MISGKPSSARDTRVWAPKEEADALIKPGKVKIGRLSPTESAAINRQAPPVSYDRELRIDFPCVKMTTHFFGGRLPEKGKGTGTQKGESQAPVMRCPPKLKPSSDGSRKLIFSGFIASFIACIRCS